MNVYILSCLLIDPRIYIYIYGESEREGERLFGKQDDSSERWSNPLAGWSDILERQEVTSSHEKNNRHRMP